MSQRSGPVAGAPGQGRGTGPFAEAPDGGLSSAEAAARLARYGPNELPRARRTPLWRMIAGQVRDPLVVFALSTLGYAAIRLDRVVHPDGRWRPGAARRRPGAP